ncbi:sulfite exporter TauE/SafE family protein [Rhodococcus opacus]|uniref:sulfite exporter TauE/SafE family protein n=1 Tax=Rhodococcus opacus TaxID=37919 RepID=UPI00294A5F94|nr:sulfite exporter TauE/SafE family protein [Rhodococcus opacus]MDV6244900.1 sulfite exporter TauE/SafE family protein [Rhodococcus opacus]
MMIVAAALGICIGIILGALGGGGSILTVPALVYALGQPIDLAITESLVIVGITSAVALVTRARAHQVKWGAGICLGAIGGIAAWVGTALARLVDPDAALAAFAVLMVIVSFSLVRRTRKPRRASCERQPDAVSVTTAGNAPRLALVSQPVSTNRQTRVMPSYKSAVKVGAAGIIMGILTGFFGVGGGFVIVPVLVIALAYPMPIAVGTSLLVITLNSAIALTARWTPDALDWSVIVPVTGAAIIGALVGKRLALKVSERTLTRSFAGFLIAVAVYVGLRSIGLAAG